MPYIGNGVAALEDGGREVAMNPQMIGRLKVRRKAFVPANDAFARWLNIVTNTNETSPEHVDMMVAGALGSVVLTDIAETSSGDQNVDLLDDWVVTNATFIGKFLMPRLGHVIQGPGAPVRASRILFHDRWFLPVWRYSFTLEPGETAIVMNFVSGQASIPRATAKSREIVNLPANAVQGMSATELARVINFDTTDCNRNGVPDTGDIASGTSLDQNANNVPDECDGDADGDGIPDDLDACPNDANNDIDGDGVCGDVDNCPDTPNADQADSDANGVGDACQQEPEPQPNPQPVVDRQGLQEVLSFVFRAPICGLFGVVGIPLTLAGLVTMKLRVRRGRRR
jgi:hypothetical protein